MGASVDNMVPSRDEDGRKKDSPYYAEMTVDFEPADDSREIADTASMPWDLSELGDEISQELALEGIEEILPDPNEQVKEPRWSTSPIPQLIEESPVLPRPSRSPAPVAIPVKSRQSSPLPASHPLSRSSYTPFPSASPSPGLYGAAASPVPAPPPSKPAIPPEPEEPWISFGEDELGDLNEAVGFAIDEALAEYMQDTPLPNKGEGHGFVALARFGPAGIPRRESTIDKLVDIAAAEQMRSQLFKWSGRRYNHEPGSFQFENGDKVKEFATDIFGINYEITLIDETALELGKESEGTIPIKTSNNPYCEVRLLVGQSSGDYGLKSINIVLKRAAAKKESKHISEFIIRSGIFLDDMLPFMLDFNNLKDRFGDKGLEGDMRTLGEVYGNLMRRYSTRREQQSRRSILPIGDYSIHLCTEDPDSPIVRVKLGIKPARKLRGKKSTLSKDGFNLVVDRYTDNFSRPREFELYLT